MDDCVEFRLVTRTTIPMDCASVSAVTVHAPSAPTTQRESAATVSQTVDAVLDESRKVGSQQAVSPPESLPQDKDDFIRQHKDLFEGLGRLPGKIHLEIDKTV